MEVPDNPGVTVQCQYTPTRPGESFDDGISMEEWLCHHIPQVSCNTDYLKATNVIITYIYMGNNITSSLYIVWSDLYTSIRILYEHELIHELVSCRYVPTYIIQTPTPTHIHPHSTA